MKKNKAQGVSTAPYLFVMVAPPSPGMESWFWKQLQACGIHKSDVRLVFMLDEEPAGKNGKPLVSQIRSARARFEREVKASKAEVVLPMGKEAFYALTGIDEPIFDARGYLIRANLFQKMPVEVYKEIGKYKRDSKVTGAKAGDPKMKYVTEAHDALLGPKFKGVVIPLFDLNHIRTEKFAIKPAFKEDVSRARRAYEGDLREIDKNFKYATRLTNKLRRTEFGDVIAVDIETHGINNEVIDLVSFSDGETTAALNWDENSRAFMEHLFALPNKIFAIHNSPFDLPRLVANGVKIKQEVIDRQIFDTMFAAVTLQPDLHKALGRVASVYLDMTPWKTSSRKETSPWRAMVQADPVGYAAKDAFATAWIARSQITIMKNLGSWNLFMGQGGHPGPGIMATIPELTKMTEVGIRIDREAATEMCHRLERRYLRYMKLWSRMFPEINPHSTPQLVKLFYEKWGLPLERRKDEGLSVDELVLVKLSAFVEAQRGSELFPGEWHTDKRCNQRTFDLLLKLRDVKKTIGTYVQPVMFNEDTWVHPQYLPVAKDDERGPNKNKESNSKGNTATGRFVAYNPNIQNQPKKVRRLYVPDRDDHCFVQADYKSAELYVMAWMAGDKMMIEDLKHDLHQRNADRHKINRDTAKNVTYASQFLAGPAKQSEMILAQNHVYVSPAECLIVSESIWGVYTDAVAYKRMLIELCDTKKYITNPFGRTRFFHDGRATAAVNFIPQSIIADILWCIFKDVAVAVRKYGARVVTTVHDSILVSAPYEKRELVAKAMKKVMERKFDCVRKGFYIPVEIEMGTPGGSWAPVKNGGSMQKWEEAA